MPILILNQFNSIRLDIMYLFKHFNLHRLTVAECGGVVVWYPTRRAPRCISSPPTPPTWRPSQLAQPRGLPLYQGFGDLLHQGVPGALPVNHRRPNIGAPAQKGGEGSITLQLSKALAFPEVGHPRPQPAPDRVLKRVNRAASAQRSTVLA